MRRAAAASAGSGAAASTRRIRVASVPATHVYVRRLAHPDVERLTDPSGDDLRTPCFLDPAWVREHGRSFDLLHVHFGFEFYDPSQLDDLTDELERQGIPLVYTCHDLTNPNHRTARLHDQALAVWMRRADEVVTLTDHAAAEIDRRFGRTATVLPHPHVVPLARLEQRPPRHRVHDDRFRFGLHFKSLRPNMIGRPLLEATLEAIAPLDGVRLRVDLHCDVVDPASDNADPDLVDLAWDTVCDAASPMDLHVHHYHSDEELWDHIDSVDAFILPYAYGTHSGLLEACRDLGTAAIAPDVGGYRDQGAHHTFGVRDDGTLDVDDYGGTLRRAVEAGPPDPLPVEERRRQRAEVAAAHARLYRRLLERAPRVRRSA